MPLINYYTPKKWTEILLSTLNSSKANGVLDPAVGNGALLREAKRRFPNAKLFGIDIDRSAIARVRRDIPTAVLSVANSLHYDSFHRSSVWDWRRRIDTIVTNPPFNGADGERTIEVSVWESTARVGVAAAHLLMTLSSFEPRQAAAIVPRSVLHSERDSVAVELIRRRYRLDRIERLSRQAFGSGSAATEIVKLTAFEGDEDTYTPMNKEYEVSAHSTCQSVNAGLLRGGLPVHLAKYEDGQTGVPYLHTRNLGQPYGDVKRVGSIGTGVVSGVAIFFPRVGMVRRELLRIWTLPHPVQLSDCVMGLCFDARAAASKACCTLQSDFCRFSECWAGTGAPYTTLKKIHQYLIGIGIECEICSNWAGGAAIESEGSGHSTANGSANLAKRTW